MNDNTVKSAAENLLPVIGYYYRSMTLMRPGYWESREANDPRTSEQCRYIRHDIRNGVMGQYAKLASAFARAVKTASDHGADIKLTDIAPETFRAGLSEISNGLQGAYSCALQIGVAEEDQGNKLEQIIALGNAQCEMVEAIAAYDANSQRNLPRPAKR